MTMNYTIKEVQRYNTKVLRVIVVALLSILSFAATAQDECVDTYYLESETIKEGQQVVYRASAAIVCKEGKQFIVDDKGQAILTAGGRLEFNPGFAILTGGGLSATIENCGGPVPPIDPKGLNVFPNPTDGVVNVKAPYKVVAARILDSNGAVLFEQKDINDFSFTLDISKTKPGVYLLEILSDKASEKVRIIKN
jgi:Secretion system C-terminal sorting domain